MSLERTAVVAMLVTSASCMTLSCMIGAQPPGMAPAVPRAHTVSPGLDELARVEGRENQRTLLAVHPRSACSATASTVLLDEDGSFVGALPPGTAALLSIPSTTRALTAMSSVEVTAPLASWTFSLVVPVPPEPSGLLLSAARISARECGTGQYADVKTASKEELEATLGEEEVVWLEPRRDVGQSWLDAHHERVAEVLGIRRKATPDVFAKVRTGASRE